MTQLPPWPLLGLWFAWVVQALLSMVAVRKFRDGFGRRRRPDFDDYRPPAAVIVPFKGCDPRMESGLASLFEQAYPDYQLLLVVESDQDPAYSILKGAVKSHPAIPARVIVAGISGPNQGQKTHNQLAAIDHLESQPNRQADAPQAWVFADSDAAPGARWLGDMIGPLCRPRIGVTTGYRWMVPVAGDRVTWFWSAMASVMNSSVACLMGKDARNHAWGGSMAMRAETARTGGLRDLLKGALSDDYQVTYMCRRLGLRVYFVRGALVASPTRMGFGDLVNFVRRQYLITRLHAPRLFATAAGLTTLYVAGAATSAAWLAGALLGGSPTASWVFAAATVSVVHSLNHRRATLRRQVIRKAFGKRVESELATTLCLDRWATSLWMTLHWLLVITATIGRTMTWRDTRYRIEARQKITRLTTGAAHNGPADRAPPSPAQS